MIQIQLQITAAPEVLDIFQKLTNALSAFMPQNLPQVEKPKRGKSIDPPVINAEVVPPAETPIVTAPAVTPPAATGAIPPEKMTLEQLRAAIKPKLDAGKREEIKAINKEFGNDKLPDLKKEDYAAFLQKVEAL